MPTTNINHLDIRISGFRRGEFVRVSEAVKKSRGGCICAVHLGVGRNILFAGSPSAERNLGRLSWLMNYRPTLTVYEEYFRDVINYLQRSDLPIFLFEDPEYPSDLTLGELIIKIPGIVPGRPKPKMQYALGHIFKRHWASLRYVFSTLGITQIEFVGEFLVDFSPKGFCPSGERFFQSELASLVLGVGKHKNLYLCVDQAVDHLVIFSFGRIQGRVNYPYTFPGLIEISG